jgi:hypothetical protein
VRRNRTIAAAIGAGLVIAIVAALVIWLPRGASEAVGDDAAVVETGDDASFETQVEPAVTAIEPAAGSLVGGETVTITGQSLDEVTAVTFGDRAATGLTVVDATTITVVAPRSGSYAAGSVPVTALVGEAAVTDGQPVTWAYEERTGVDRQMAYAFRHWNSYNPEYGDYNPVGGDCMNFVSQTLLVRGWQMDDAWRSANATGSEAFVYVPTFETYLERNQERIGWTRYEADQRDQVKIGDLVMMDWNPPTDLNHIQVVSDIIHDADGTISIKMVGHNIDTDYRDLDETMTVDHPGMSAYFVSLPAA